MKAVVITTSGDPRGVELREVPAPEPGFEQVRVRVRHAGVNRADLLQVLGHYPAPPGAPADIPGLEFAGEVETLGPGTTGTFQPGDRVFGIVGGGGNAEFVVVHERTLVLIPANLDWEQAGAVPEVFFTAFDALENQAGVKPGERILVHAVGGGVGTAAVQLARAMGCEVFGTSRTAGKLERARDLGLDHGIDTSTGEFAATVLGLTGGRGVHAIVDHLGASAMLGNIEALAIRGRLVLVGTLSGSKAEVPLSTVMRKRLSIVGTVLRSRPIEEKIALTRAFADRVVPWLASGRVRPVLDRVYPAEQVAEAHARMSANLGFGKILLAF